MIPQSEVQRLLQEPRITAAKSSSLPCVVALLSSSFSSDGCSTCWEQQLHPGCCGGDGLFIDVSTTVFDFPLLGQSGSHLVRLIFLWLGISLEKSKLGCHSSHSGSPSSPLWVVQLNGQKKKKKNLTAVNLNLVHLCLMVMRLFVLKIEMKQV